MMENVKLKGEMLTTLNFYLKNKQRVLTVTLGAGGECVTFYATGAKETERKLVAGFMKHEIQSSGV
jgi:hypothetical protein